MKEHRWKMRPEMKEKAKQLDKERKQVHRIAMSPAQKAAENQRLKERMRVHRREAEVEKRRPTTTLNLKTASQMQQEIDQRVGKGVSHKK